jgi:hypothetical protein
MSFDVYLPFLAAAAFALLGTRIADRLRPAQATWMLSCGAVATSACSLCSLVLLAWSLLARFSPVASIGDWSVALFAHHDPVSVGVSIPAIVVLTVVCLRTGRALVRHVRSLAAVYRTCRQLPGAIGELVVITDETMDACALPGRPGRIVVSQRMLASLSAGERAAVLAHERSHLTHRHHLHQVAVALAAAANPLLRRVPRATSDAVERWADQDAARCIRDADGIATALCRAAAEHWTPRFDHARRLAALRRPVRRGSWAVLTLSVAGCLCLLIMSAEAAADASQLARHSAGPASTSAAHHQRAGR